MSYRLTISVLLMVACITISCGSAASPTPAESTIPVATVPDATFPPLATDEPLPELPTESPATSLVIPPNMSSLGTVSATITIDGSSTVFPIAERTAIEFGSRVPSVQIQLGVSGTGGGFEKFCAGETVISNASRPIKQSEADTCAQAGISFVELPIAFDGISVVRNPQNTWAECMTTAELKKVWEPAAEGQMMRWNQVREGWPDSPLTLYGAGRDSGTYDYFTSAIVGEEGVSRNDFVGSEDDYLLAQDVTSDPNGLAFFGFAYYQEYEQQLSVTAIDNGAGCIAPSIKTIANGTYQPLSRPLFLYVRADALTQPEVKAFIDFFLLNAKPLIEEVRYIPLSERVYQLVINRATERRTGSVFAGGSQIGVSLEELLMLEGQ